MKTKQNSFPRLPADAEAIFKMRFAIDGTGAREFPFPELSLLANADGFRYLARLFDYVANEAKQNDDPDFHLHLGRREPPFNGRLSDDVELRIGILPPGNRREVYLRYGISRAARKKGDMATYLMKLVKDAKTCIRREAVALRKWRQAMRGRVKSARKC